MGPTGLLFGLVCLAALWAIFHHYVVRLHDARAWLSKGAALLDVDTPAEFFKHHPPVAFNIPREELLTRAAEVGPKDGAVVVFAHSWLKGVQAVHDLRGMGFSSVMNAAGLHTKEAFSGHHAKTPEAQNQHPDLVELKRVSMDDLLHPAANAPRNGGTTKHDTSLK